MRWFATVLIVAALLVVLARTALARADADHNLACAGGAYAAVDANAIDAAHKSNTVLNFLVNTPFALDCTLAGPLK